MLANLLTNAAKYGQLGTEIGIEVGARDDYVEVTVTNYGAGIALDELPFLFGKFARAHDARRTRAPILGLGLYIAKGLVEAHSSRIWAESVPGDTTRFHFTMPRKVSPESARLPDEEASLRTRRRRPASTHVVSHQPNVTEKTSMSESRNSISKSRSTMGLGWRIS